MTDWRMDTRTQEVQHTIDLLGANKCWTVWSIRWMDCRFADWRFNVVLHRVVCESSRIVSYRVLNAAYKHYSLKTNTTDCSYIHVICTYVRPPVCMSDCRYGVLFVMSKKTMHSQKSTMVWAQWENFQENAKPFRIRINQYLTSFTCELHIQVESEKYYTTCTWKQSFEYTVCMDSHMFCLNINWIYFDRTLNINYSGT